MRCLVVGPCLISSATVALASRDNNIFLTINNIDNDHGGDGNGNGYRAAAKLSKAQDEDHEQK